MREAASGGEGAIFPRWLRLLILVVAILETLEALASLPILFGDLSEVPGLGLGSGVVTATIALRPIFALAAVFLAARTRLRVAIMALAAVIVLNWTSLIPSVVLHGLDFRGVGGLSSLQFLVSPILAVSAGFLAWAERQIRLAALLVAAPTLFQGLGIVAFAISVSLHGF